MTSRRTGAPGNPPPFRFTAEQRSRLAAGPLKFVRSTRKRDELVTQVENGLWGYRLVRVHEIPWGSLAPHVRRLESHAAALDEFAQAVGTDVYINRALVSAFGVEHVPATPAWTRAAVAHMAAAVRAQAARMKRPRGGQRDEAARQFLAHLMAAWLVLTGEAPSAAQSGRFMRLIDWLREERLFHGSRKLVATLLTAEST